MSHTILSECEVSCRSCAERAGVFLTPEPKHFLPSQSLLSPISDLHKEVRTSSVPTSYALEKPVE
jgi:hypothetical protein